MPYLSPVAVILIAANQASGPRNAGIPNKMTSFGGGVNVPFSYYLWKVCKLRGIQISIPYYCAVQCIQRDRFSRKLEMLGNLTALWEISGSLPKVSKLLGKSLVRGNYCWLHVWVHASV